jgi:hypothetical protein
VRRLQIGATEERFPVRRLSGRADLVVSMAVRKSPLVAR